MKTTIDIADPLLERAKAEAAARSISLRALIEEQLRRLFEEQERAPGRFVLKPLPVRGGGFQPGVDASDWSAVRDEIYRGRGA